MSVGGMGVGGGAVLKGVTVGGTDVGGGEVLVGSELGGTGVGGGSVLVRVGVMVAGEAQPTSTSEMTRTRNRKAFLCIMTSSN